MVYSLVVRRALFRLGGGDPETVHERTLRALAMLGAIPPAVAALHRYFGATSPRTLFGIQFPNAVGLAAGGDKDGVALRAWPALGFGFVEVGTVTQHTQDGNPRPRLFRLPASEAIINRMGFNNAGADALANHLSSLRPLTTPLGISIGKSKITSIDEAVSDYLYSLRILHRFADYFAINVSSPNTPGLRDLQDRAALEVIVGELRRESRVPLLVKIAPDLSDEAIDEILEVCVAHSIDGVIATNTTLRREGISGPDEHVGKQAGGLSGRPLWARAREVVAFVAKHTDGKLPIIGVGGISSADDAMQMLDAGASLIQLYTGLVYKGPSLIRQINRAIAHAGR